MVDLSVNLSKFGSSCTVEAWWNCLRGDKHLCGAVVSPGDDFADSFHINPMLSDTMFAIL